VRAVTAWIAIAGAAASFASGWTATGLLALAVLAELCASDVALHRALGGARIPLRWAWIGLAVPLLGPLVLASLFLDPHVGWRGRDYTLNHSARLG
jgi:hypothetical protein